MYDELYKAYTDNNVLLASPVQLVVALYRGGIDAVEQARQCLATDDIMARSKCISKAIEILGELLGSLDHEKGGEVSRRLASLYCYMQSRILEAHTRQADAPLAEVSSLLTTLLEGWEKVAAQMEPPAGTSTQQSFSAPDSDRHSFVETF